MSKGSHRRPGILSDAQWDAIFKPKPPECPVCKPDPCVCTKDGPGQEEADKDTVYEWVYAVDRQGNQRLISKKPADGSAAKPPYDRRRFKREGV